jgi:hypothetical protein
LTVVKAVSADEKNDESNNNIIILINFMILSVSKNDQPLSNHAIIIHKIILISQYVIDSFVSEYI